MCRCCKGYGGDDKDQGALERDHFFFSFYGGVVKKRKGDREGGWRMEDDEVRNKTQ